METFFLTLYVLIWPVLVAGVLFGIARSFLREWATARREGRRLI
ncbi:putative transporter small subunit [Zhihengliuella salsuginis]|uniref:Uncharacterized protein n=1 Tax=Zhihengliuella salsuginis TaxID=578222 RepID=A0ABQ3GG25_9MICC|nr:putative transporter small subunit [Zhihengliuella salsuginis]GHD03747.1 hypothetical protein GCM10008096_10180 [Zhihengliuella salsuginis]